MGLTKPKEKKDKPSMMQRAQQFASVLSTAQKASKASVKPGLPLETDEADLFPKITLRGKK
jgi:hypothetical protein